MCSIEWIQINILENINKVDVFDLNLLLEKLGLERSVILKVPIPPSDAQWESSNYLQINIYGVTLRYLTEEMNVNLVHSLNSLGINSLYIQDMSYAYDLTLPNQTEPALSSYFRTSTPKRDHSHDSDRTVSLYPFSESQLLNMGVKTELLSSNQSYLNKTDVLATTCTSPYGAIFASNEEVAKCVFDMIDFVSQQECPFIDCDESLYCSASSSGSSPRKKDGGLSPDNSLLQITGFTSVLMDLRKESLCASTQEVMSFVASSESFCAEFEEKNDQEMDGANVHQLENSSNVPEIEPTALPCPVNRYVTRSSKPNNPLKREASPRPTTSQNDDCNMTTSSIDSNFLKPKRAKKLWKDIQKADQLKRRAAFCYRKNCGMRLNFVWMNCQSIFRDHARSHLERPLYKCYKCDFLSFIILQMKMHFRKEHHTKNSCFQQDLVLDLAEPEDLAEMKLFLGVLLLVALAHAMPFDQAAKAVYDDSFARNKILPICSATDNDDPSICLNRRFTNAELKRRHKVICSPYLLDHCIGYSAALHDDKAIVLAFKGTQGVAQLLLESEETIFSNHTTWVSGGTVSKYFSDGFFALWKHGLKDDFLALRNKYPGYQLWVAGHSLGGAMASLAASYVVHTKLFDGNNTRLVTFGQPRTGDRQYSDSVDAEIPYAFRLVHGKDVVPHLPPNHVENYHHHHSEVFYNNDMTTASYVVCRTDEDLFCSDGKIDTSVSEHVVYFNKDVTDWGLKGCA